MSLLDQPALTTDAKQQIAAQTIVTQLNTMLSKITTGYSAIFDRVWNDPNGLTPQQVCDALATNAGQLFLLASSLKTLVNSAKSNAITLTEPNQFTIDQDGTVTIGDPVDNGSGN